MLTSYLEVQGTNIVCCLWGALGLGGFFFFALLSLATLLTTSCLRWKDSLWRKYSHGKQETFEI